LEWVVSNNRVRLRMVRKPRHRLNGAAARPIEAADRRCSRPYEAMASKLLTFTTGDAWPCSPLRYGFYREL